MKVFLFNSDDYQDYLSDLINYYFINSSHEITSNYLPNFLFNDFNDQSNLYGKGFTLYGKVDAFKKNKVKVLSDNELIPNLVDGNYDLVIFTSIRRHFNGNEIKRKYFDTVSSSLIQNNTIAVDGEDDNFIIDQVAKKIPYFKRELLPTNSRAAFPISFSFPAQYKNFKIDNINEKTTLLAPMDPRFLNSYVFEEENYYIQYAKSIFGTTTKKNGWDCLRHYEIISAGCLPYFPGIEEKPKTIMKNYPLKLQQDINSKFEKILLSAKNIDTKYNLGESTKSKTINKGLKKMSDLNLIENNLSSLQKYIDEFAEWRTQYGTSEIYSKAFKL